jgi:catechol 2,3-dioxygenase-like lactoylglutathione lyase family enzyme
MPASLKLTMVNIGAPEPASLARFYERLLGWSITTDETEWVVLEDPNGGVGLAFQLEPGYRPPVWPTAEGEQQMMLHLEIRVTDLTASVDHALECGATLAKYQPQDDVRVCLDPAGHPFCLYLH